MRELILPLLAATALAGCAPQQTPTEKINAACKSEYGADERGMLNCQIRLKMKLLQEQQSGRMDRAAAAAR